MVIIASLAAIAEGPNPWLAFVGPLIVALVAAGIATWTLIEVYRQISIARSQIELANEQIRISNDQKELAAEQKQLAIDELVAVREDLANNKTQLQELLKRPDLTLDVYPQGAGGVLMTNNARPARDVSLRLVVTNKGTAVARDVMLELLVRADHLAIAENINDINVAPKPQAPAGYFLHPNSTTYAIYRLPLAREELLYPDGYTVEKRLRLFYLPEYDHTEVRYRLFDQFGAYPKTATEDGPYRLLPEVILYPVTYSK